MLEARTQHWPGTVDSVLGGDQVLALAYCTPASGVVIAPVTNFGLRDPATGTVIVNSSVGAWKKLDRIRRNPRVALAFHTRRHGFSDRPEYVLLQGTALALGSDSRLSEHDWRALGALREVARGSSALEAMAARLLPTGRDRGCSRAGDRLA